MTALEDPQHATVGVATGIDRCIGVLVLQRTRAGHAESRRTEVGPPGLGRARLLQADIDQCFEASGLGRR